MFFKLFGTQSEKYIRTLRPQIERINALEPAMLKGTDAELREKAGELRGRILQNLAGIQAEIDELSEQWQEATTQNEKDALKRRLKDLRNTAFADALPEAFALVREASRRTIGLRHFDVQLMGGIVLHEGKIAEMITGEGKTLVATLAVVLNALTGKGVHVVTVNDYLARRDRNWMGPIYEFLGLSVGVIYHDMAHEEKQQAYRCDITYGTNNEFGFDYLRDHMVMRAEDLVQRPLHYAIVDEVDSILVDEARTPLIISGPTEVSAEKYYTIDRIIPRLTGRMITDKEEIDAKHEGKDLEQGYDYLINEKNRTVHLTDEGVLKCEKLLGVKNLYDDIQAEWEHHIRQALIAHSLYKRDVDYVVKDGQIVIVDDFTGRLMPGRRWSDGLHQAIEAKEQVTIERENQTLATITLQNYFRMYDKLAGMTGTAETEAAEFHKIYGLDVVVVPTNKALRRTNFPDLVYRTRGEKFQAVCKEIVELHRAGRPVLVGTISIENSERLSDSLRRYNVPHHVLNAKYHEKEAEIIAQAGQPHVVTIATNMAGRGTDIVLGDGVADKGGLHVIGTERHESRRIDNQLRGRTGRQGDPGSSRFYLSLEDDLLRIFGSDRIMSVMDRFGFEEGQVIEHPWVTRSIETAQKRVEQYNFGIRKHLIEYDNVMNKQREIIYAERRFILEMNDLGEYVRDIMSDVVEHTAEQYFTTARDSDLPGFAKWIRSRFGVSIGDEAAMAEWEKEQVAATATDQLQQAYVRKVQEAPAGMMRMFERFILLQVLDAKWKDHLYNMDSLREGIGLRAYGQRDPLIEYQHEAYELFQTMVSRIKEDSVEMLFKVRTDHEQPLTVRRVAATESHPEAPVVRDIAQRVADQSAPAAHAAPANPHEKQQTYKKEGPKIGRNEPCPCGSGKKYKKCCGLQG